MAPLQVRDFNKDVIYLYQFAGTSSVSSMSPFCVKVEAFCRLHKLKFERRNTFTARGANGLLPFIELNGVQTCESQIIWTRLTDHFQLKASCAVFQHLPRDLQNFADPQSEALGHAIERMVENHTFYLLRFDANRTAGAFVRAILADRVPSFLLPAVAAMAAIYVRRKTRSLVRTVIGNFKDAEYDEMLRYDLLQLQSVLDDKQFLMGETPTEVDCIALAHVGHAYYRLPHARSRVHDLIDSEELSALKEYFERVVKTLFADEFKNKE